jgi:hypothetical protein
VSKLPSYSLSIFPNSLGPISYLSGGLYSLIDFVVYSSDLKVASRFGTNHFQHFPLESSINFGPHVSVEFGSPVLSSRRKLVANHSQVMTDHFSSTVGSVDHFLSFENLVLKSTTLPPRSEKAKRDFGWKALLSTTDRAILKDRYADVLMALSTARILPSTHLSPQCQIKKRKK